jgi:hypothetical protein
VNVSGNLKTLPYILTICFISCGSPKSIVDYTKKGFIIKPGQGTNQLNLGKTEITTAFALLGKNDKLEEKISDGIDTSFTTYSYVFNNLGLTVVASEAAELNKGVIEHLYFSKTATVKTSKGIIMNNSTLEQVLIAYGKPDNQDKYADVTILHYKKKGISLLIEKAINKVTGMEVYKPNGFSSHL